MPESLTDWFEGFVARQSNWKSRAKRKVKPEPEPKPELAPPQLSDCHGCDTGLIAGGKSRTSRFARAAGLCQRCYNSRDVQAKWTAAEMKTRGVCKQCGDEPIADGESLHARRARRRKLGWKCVRANKREKPVYKRGICRKCRNEPIAGGKSTTAMQAAKMKLGWQCFEKRTRTYGAHESVAAV